mmetsp:Transcript_2660/g.9548  ORF Transcript_2660/g.9548 Transcript_2660/m.9548 type:complete len:90 (-) Transcript_2660:1564-1833(-)
MPIHASCENWPGLTAPFAHGSLACQVPSSCSKAKPTLFMAQWSWESSPTDGQSCSSVTCYSKNGVITSLLTLLFVVDPVGTSLGKPHAC